jgi:hypothetical protein
MPDGARRRCQRYRITAHTAPGSLLMNPLPSPAAAGLTAFV